jgi:hypothetical protein
MPENPNAVAYNSDPNNFTVTDPTQAGRSLETCTEDQKRDTTSECYCSPEDRGNPDNKRCYEGEIVGVEGKNRSMWEIGGEEFNNVVNASGRFATNVFEAPLRKRQNEQAINTATNFMNQQADKDAKDFGDQTAFGHKHGLTRYRDMGSDDVSRAPVIQRGGAIPYFEQDEVVSMSPEDLENYLQAGGKVEYLY